jgi:hypothetical protein
MTTKVVVGVLVAVVFGIGVVYFLLQGDSEIVSETRTPVAQDVMEDVTPGDVVDMSENIVLAPVGNYTGVGNASRIYEGGHFLHMATASIEDPPEGKFYEGWLVKQDPELAFISTGKMVKNGNTYYLEFTDEEDLRDYNEVVITEETEANGLDGNPETHVLEGSFE